MMEKEKFQGKQMDQNNEPTTLKEEKEQTNKVMEEKEKDILEDSQAETFAEQNDKLKEEDTHVEEEVANASSELDLLKTELEEAKDKYLRLYSEFENFRRRTAKERLELVKTANEDLVVALLPVLDDFERASKALGEQGDAQAVKEGVGLVHNKFLKVLELKGLKPMGDLKGEAFNPDMHEAITQTPAPDESQKGKIVDIIENGYYLNDKVIRYAKVVIGA